MGCIGILLPFLGIIGYANQIWWLFYVAGGIAAVLDITAIINGQLRCFGTIATVVFWIAGYRYTGSLWDGLLLGSCVSSIVIMVGTFLFMAFTVGIGTAIAGLINAYEWIRNFFGRS